MIASPFPLVIIRDLNLVGAVRAPNETNSILSVDADGILSSSIALERFELIAWGRAQVFDCLSVMQHDELATGDLLEGEVFRN